MNDGNELSNTDKLLEALGGIYADAANNTLTLTKATPRIQEFARAPYIPERRRIDLIEVMIDRLPEKEKPVAWLQVYGYFAERPANHQVQFQKIVLDNIFAAIKNLPEDQQYQATRSIDYNASLYPDIKAKAAEFFKELQEHGFARIANRMGPLPAAERALNPQ